MRLRDVLGRHRVAPQFIVEKAGSGAIVLRSLLANAPNFGIG
jgi:hypothetical protein